MNIVYRLKVLSLKTEFSAKLKPFIVLGKPSSFPLYRTRNVTYVNVTKTSAKPDLGIPVGPK
jgi:hypothetical protein